MDIEAIEGVRDLVLRYADAINLYDVDQFADTFGEHAVWDVQGYFCAEGRQTIRDTFVDMRNRFEWVLQVVHGTRVLEVDGDVAKARSYVMEHGNLRGEGYTFLAAYQDRCERQNGVWRFVHRTCDPVYAGAADMSAATRAYPVPKRI